MSSLMHATKWSMACRRIVFSEAGPLSKFDPRLVSVRSFEARCINLIFTHLLIMHHVENSVIGIQQIAIGSLNKNALTDFWVNILGIEKVGSYRSEKENVDEEILSLGTGAHRVEIDLMQPIDPEKAPKVHVPALNHIGLWVDNLAAAVVEMTAKGVIFTPGGIRKGAAGHDVAFIHPRSAVGVLVELVQAPDDVILALSKK